MTCLISRPGMSCPRKWPSGGMNILVHLRSFGILANGLKLSANLGNNLKINMPSSFEAKLDSYAVGIPGTKKLKNIQIKYWRKKNITRSTIYLRIVIDWARTFLHVNLMNICFKLVQNLVLIKQYSRKLTAEFKVIKVRYIQIITEIIQNNVSGISQKIKMVK